MSQVARFFGVSLLLLAVALLPVWSSAQDKNDPAKKDEPPAKKDNPAKKDDAKADPKAGKTKPKAPTVEKVKYDSKVEAKIKKVNLDMNNQFTIEVIEIDPVRLNDMQIWQNQQTIAYNQAKPQDRFRLQYQYNIELAKKQANLYVPKDYDVRALDTVKIRTMDPPMEYDDKGFEKKWTAKELAALKGNTTLPGYPATLEALKVGQDAWVYMVRAKQPPRKLGEAPPAEALPGVVLIIIEPQPK